MEAKFTPTVKDIIQYSREEALRIGNDYIGVEHLLLGILRDDNVKNSALQVLRFSNINLKELKNKISKKLIELNYNEKTTLSVPLTKQAEKVLKLTYLEAKINSSSSITSVHLLLSILRDEDNFAAETLINYELTYSTLQTLLNQNEYFSNLQIEEGTDFDVKSKETYKVNNVYVNECLDTAPVSLIFDTSEFSHVEIKEMISLLSDLYSNISGDYLKISGMNQFDKTLFLA
ncbi:Clp protease N-terminal domain-containing protein [Mucilaginibacter lutimaris]|uniref:Clp protease N-terminal domain-containing protein n=1 Tax=Mucilaginibacter lutimaris TaxID=931629 RepID=A0ABW2ZGV3_9SPHI